MLTHRRRTAPPFPPMFASRSGTKASSTVLSKHAAGIGCRTTSTSSPRMTERNSDKQTYHSALLKLNQGISWLPGQDSNLD